VPSEQPTAVPQWTTEGTVVRYLNYNYNRHSRRMDKSRVGEMFAQFGPVKKVTVERCPQRLRSWMDLSH